MLGEVHGISETLDFLGRAVCSIASSGKPVVLALEYPRDEQSSIDSFLRNSNAFWAEADLLRTPFWNQSPSDGRASEALLDLLRKVRSWRENKLPITVVAYDIPAGIPTDVDRESANAKFLSDLLQRQKSISFTIIHSGNIHTRKTRGVPSDSSFEPLGFRLREWDMLHLNMATAGGSAWNCSAATGNVCGPHAVGPNSSTILERYSVRLVSTSSAYDGIYYIGQATESPPARRPPFAPDPLPSPDIQEP
jgi:hypothetical protein